MLFFVNENDMGFWLEGYAHIGQHFQPSWDYMLSCRLMRPGKLSDEAKALVQEWDNLGPDDDRYTAKVCARLTYPKRKNYIGN